ncbi:putative enoyl-CoA hydratase echA12 [Mycobacterium attenuatum]|uniref:Putative enoyl-CoA hydratase echA12 n=2 Tax=Mycobacterium attenuatum TaxID=2341086 RepID=A0A498QFV9_9MYCO|nr:putative enoyl-CoA hydratase echA12 [Mycobacterium attenuatum]VBA61993.1 putative enoyl-CoA hydratase echA12 [Mycobacterium attenuatum]
MFLASERNILPGMHPIDTTNLSHLDTLPTLAPVVLEYPRPDVALIVLNRPDRMNALGFELVVALKQTLEKINVDNSVRVVVLTGAGRGFCTGADEELAGKVPHELPRLDDALRAQKILDEVTWQLRRMHQPVIAAVNGATHCGGMYLALAADIRVVADNAYFRAADIRNGLTGSELGLSYLLPRAIGSSRAFELMLTGRDVDASEAERIGLASCRVADKDLLDYCFSMAGQIAGLSRIGTEFTKRTLWSSLDAANVDGRMGAEGLGQLYVRSLTSNCEEAVGARAENRLPVLADCR